MNPIIHQSGSLVRHITLFGLGRERHEDAVDEEPEAPKADHYGQAEEFHWYDANGKKDQKGYDGDAHQSDPFNDFSDAVAPDSGGAFLR